MKKVAIVAGGDSSEYEVSLRSAAGIYGFIDKTKYSPVIVCLHGKEWKACVNTAAACSAGLNPADSTQWTPIDRNDFSYTDAAGTHHTFDYAYITIHGTPGENGILQGYFDLIGLPYSCCDVLPAAITFNKYFCNHYLHGFGVNISHSILLRRGDSVSNERVLEETGLPCFIKSNVGGSSFGCTKVKTAADIQPAIETAFKEGDEVIIEALMTGTEVTSGMYSVRDSAAKEGRRDVVFPITEVVTSNEFFDYDAKYKGQVDEITPARVSDSLRDAIQAQTRQIYAILGCKGIIRVDYILVPTSEPDDAAKHIADGHRIMLLEVNTTPGMTATSFIPQQVRAAGMSMTQVLSDIIG